MEFGIIVGNIFDKSSTCCQPTVLATISPHVGSKFLLGKFWNQQSCRHVGLLLCISVSIISTFWLHLILYQCNIFVCVKIYSLLYQFSKEKSAKKLHKHKTPPAGSLLHLNIHRPRERNGKIKMITTCWRPPPPHSPSPAASSRTHPESTSTW